LRRFCGYYAKACEIEWCEDGFIVYFIEHSAKKSSQSLRGVAIYEVALAPDSFDAPKSAK
jgi:hypothetical protein